MRQKVLAVITASVFLISTPLLVIYAQTPYEDSPEGTMPYYEGEAPTAAPPTNGEYGPAEGEDYTDSTDDAEPPADAEPGEDATDATDDTDPSGARTETRVSEGGFYTYVDEYDEHGTLIHNYTIDNQTGHMTNEIMYGVTYDSEGNQVEYWLQQVVDYHDNGRVAVRVQYHPDGSVMMAKQCDREGHCRFITEEVQARVDNTDDYTDTQTDTETDSEAPGEDTTDE